MRRILLKIVAAVALAIVLPCAFPDLGLLVPFVMFGAVVGAKLEFTPAELDGLLERAVAAREQKEWEEKVLKAGCSLRGGIFVLHRSTAGLRDCTELCRTPFRYPHWLPAQEPGTVVEYHPGDYRPEAHLYRELLGEEAAGVIPVHAGLRVGDGLREIRTREDGKKALLREDQRVEAEIEALRQRRLHIAEEVEKADRGIAAASKPLDEFFSGWPPEKQLAAIELARELEQKKKNPAPLGDYAVVDEATAKESA